MTKQTGTIITIVVAVLTLCCSASCFVSGIIMAADVGQWMGDTYVEPWLGLPLICLGILVWVVPLLLWVFLVRGKENSVQHETEEYLAGTIEDELARGEEDTTP